ncbi:phage holin family protein [Rhizobium sp. FKL33]|uniref:phage holin family protein n=1 Tax=Rhizobium sp. FKL33 TaxID=2562307 RepID=UPI0010C0FB2E|nr:phage holin family protein [Rhizobium sp. FKL33]
MSEKFQSLHDAVSYWLGGAGSSLIVAACARLMFHGNEARNQRRKFWGWELLYELPAAVALGMFGEAIASYFGVDSSVRPAVVGGLAYLGPRGIEVLFQRWLSKLPPPAG